MVTALAWGWSLMIMPSASIPSIILQEMLTRWRLKPTVVESGSEALAEMEKAAACGEPFPLVLSDVMMPEMDGFMLAEEIKRHPELAAPTLLMLSSANQKDIARCREAGIAAYLMKPVKQSELLDVIVTSLNKTAPRKTIDPTARDRGKGPAQPPPSSPPLQLLLAEDNATNQMLAIILLEKQGHSVVIANNGKEALAALDQRVRHGADGCRDARDGWLRGHRSHPRKGEVDGTTSTDHRHDRPCHEG